MTGWQPTPALLRGCAVMLAAPLIGVLIGRPALVVLAVPFVVLTAAGLWHRPLSNPGVTSRLRRRTVREGETSVVETTVGGLDADAIGWLVLPVRYVVPRTGGAATTLAATGPTMQLHTDLRALRWGRHEVGGGQLAVTSRWGGFRWGPDLVATSRLVVLPQAAPFDSTAEAPHPVGLVGANRSRHQGDGREFASIREFVSGDRLRRIHWRTSLRTGTLHVVTTTVEQDSAVLLLVDAMADLGHSGGIDGQQSSLDVTMRAAGALAEHHLRIGDRVGLRVIARSGQIIAPRAGMRQHRLILESLTQVEPGRPDHFDAARIQLGLSAGTVVLVLSPLLAPEVGATLVALSRSGLPVVAIDTSPPGLDEVGDSARLSTAALAWRLRLLEREVQLRGIVATGTPVVRWQGPGTLDEVLRRLGRRARMPRVATR
ncbi:DUF58 domain-containing protein [Nocardioides terrisoli]|uniref:DUF58 domain-containing protein n=1 Tax=Nocardioides terrisoli TaxID=3388267 RepID=UPI00287B9B76|nr:DUF58 domain-containing protein [Nocardioides marmorisolisilvae]